MSTSGSEPLTNLSHLAVGAASSFFFFFFFLRLFSPLSTPSSANASFLFIFRSCLFPFHRKAWLLSGLATSHRKGAIVHTSTESCGPDPCIGCRFSPEIWLVVSPARSADEAQQSAMLGILAVALGVAPGQSQRQRSSAWRRTASRGMPLSRRLSGFRSLSPSEPKTA